MKVVFLALPVNIRGRWWPSNAGQMGDHIENSLPPGRNAAAMLRSADGIRGMCSKSGYRKHYIELPVQYAPGTFHPALAVRN